MSALLTCASCARPLPRAPFPQDARPRLQAIKRGGPCTCSRCLESDATNRFSLGELTRTCSQCGAVLFEREGPNVCCNLGTHAVDFSTFFRDPPEHLLAIYRRRWPTAANGPQRATPKASSPAASSSISFSAMSRRVNDLFCLAQHVAQSSSDERELHLAAPGRPANIRIHGTMYRKIFTAADAAPLRYLIVDPLERTKAAATLELRPAIVEPIERFLLTNIPALARVRPTPALLTSAAAPIRHRPAAATQAKRRRQRSAPLRSPARCRAPAEPPPFPS